MDIYDIYHLNEKPKTVDILHDLQEQDAVATSLISSVLHDRNGSEFICIEYTTKEKKTFFKILNLKTMEVKNAFPKGEGSTDIPGYQYYPSELDNLLKGTNLSEKFETLGLKISKSGRMLYPTSEKVSNKYFKSLFPNNKGKLTEDNQVFILVDTIPKLLTNYERFFESPKELYKDLVIEADHSTDGREHTVQSKEEFLQYYQAPQEEN